MKTKITLLALALGASTCLVTAQDNPPPADSQPPPAQTDGGSGGMSGQHGPDRHRGFHLLPPRAEQQLQLTDDQKKQIAALEAETQAKLEKILTPEQMEKLKNMHPPMRPGGPGRGFGGNNSGGDDQPPGPPPGGDGDSNGGPPGNN